tara:strand:- start:32742 stop:34661 length:1920 start_codon:yes stop_codon:yes gene_type:complete
MNPLSDKIKAELKATNLTKLHSGLLSQALAWVDYSRSVMSGYYASWDDNYERYDAVHPVTRRKDEQAQEEERPSSQSIPITYAQVQTWKAFASQLLGQKQKFYEFMPGGKEDEKWRDLAEDVLQADLLLDKWVVKRGQFLANIAITNLGVLKTGWHEKRISIETVETEEATAFGQNWNNLKTKGITDVVTHRGNQTEVLSPYRFFPDPAVSLTDALEGRFIASEHEFTTNELLAMEARGEVTGVKDIPKVFTSTRWDKRKDTSRLTAYKHETDKNQVVVVTEVQMKVVPSAFELDDGTKLGPGTSQMILSIWIANDQRVIRAELMNYLHGEFTYDVAVFDTERHKYMRKAITELTADMQKNADWFLNSRVESVTRNVESQLIVDPIAIDVGSVKSRSRVITLRKGAARAGIDRYIKQLNTTDPTTNNMRDIQDIIRLNQMTTGVNDNMLGQYNTGRRSATESRVVASGASARAAVILEEIFVQALAPNANKRLKNLRQGLTKVDLMRLVGERDATHIKAFKADPVAIATNNDMFSFDGTTPSEKSFLAQSLQELLGLVLQNPDTAVQLNLSPRLILEKIYELRGLNFKDDLGLDKDPQTMQSIIMEKAQQMAVEYLQKQGLLNPNGQSQQSAPPQGATQ